MKIKYDGSERQITWKEMFYIGFYQWDESDYGFSIILFGREWSWLVWTGGDND